MTLLPSRPSVDRDDVSPAMVDLDEGIGKVLPALRSDTARAILSELYNDPVVASELAETVDTSLQNVQYHLDKLQEADLVTVAGTWYSEKGKEMKVYAPANEPLLLVFGGDEETDACAEVLTEI